MKKSLLAATAAVFITLIANLASAEVMKAQLKDGAMVEINGDKMTIMKNGHATPAEDADYVLMMDGKEKHVTVKEGKAWMK